MSPKALKNTQADPQFAPGYGRLLGKVALVTGIAHGIGQGIGLMFARQGAAVIGCDIDEEGAAATAAIAAQEGWSLHALTCDLMTEGGAQSLIDAAVARYGGFDILVNAAAVGIFKWLDDMSYADWRTTMTGELDIVFLAVKAAWPHLKARGGGSIINFASANAYHALEQSGALAHCAGKGGVLAMTRQLAMEGGPYNIRANTISPALIRTKATEEPLKNPAFVDNVLAKGMIKRLGTPEDAAWLATFLASDESTWITGADFNLDGGATAW
jgi:NAD(P)-dependent dehydrogenase (short-subunit alcohol dehydrogenase family)